jgi:hypothetical protein
MSLFASSKADNKNKSYESFESCKATPPIVTEALFVPLRSVKHAFTASGVMDGGSAWDTVHDLSASMVVAADYEGGLKIYIKRSVFDDIVEANRVDVTPDAAGLGDMPANGGGAGGGGFAAGPGMFGSVGGGYDPSAATEL